jgi:hypothetical protein
VAQRDPRPPRERRAQRRTDGLNLCVKRVKRCGHPVQAVRPPPPARAPPRPPSHLADKTSSAARSGPASPLKRAGHISSVTGPCLRRRRRGFGACRRRLLERCPRGLRAALVERRARRPRHCRSSPSRFPYRGNDEPNPGGVTFHAQCSDLGCRASGCDRSPEFSASSSVVLGGGHIWTLDRSPQGREPGPRPGRTLRCRSAVVRRGAPVAGRRQASRRGEPASAVWCCWCFRGCSCSPGSCGRGAKGGQSWSGPGRPRVRLIQRGSRPMGTRWTTMATGQR